MKIKQILQNFFQNLLVEFGATLSIDKEVLVSGSFEDALKCHSSRRNVLHLSSNHKEADTRMIIHALGAVKQDFKAIIVDSKDTDVFLLLIYFLGQCPVQTWMLSGTSRQKICHPIHEIHNQLS